MTSLDVLSTLQAVYVQDFDCSIKEAGKAIRLLKDLRLVANSTYPDQPLRLTPIGRELARELWPGEQFETELDEETVQADSLIGMMVKKLTGN